MTTPDITTIKLRSIRTHATAIASTAKQLTLRHLAGRSPTAEQARRLAQRAKNLLFIAEAIQRAIAIDEAPTRKKVDPPCPLPNQRALWQEPHDG